MGSIPVAGATEKGAAVQPPFLWHPQEEPTSASEAQRKWVRIPRPKIGKLAWQAQGEGIFAAGEIPVFMRYFKTKSFLKHSLRKLFYIH